MTFADDPARALPSTPSPIRGGCACCACWPNSPEIGQQFHRDAVAASGYQDGTAAAPPADHGTRGLIARDPAGNAMTVHADAGLRLGHDHGRGS